MTNLEKALHKAARYGHDRKQGWQAFCEEWAGGLDALADNQALERLQRTLLTGYLPNDGAAADQDQDRTEGDFQSSDDDDDDAGDADDDGGEEDDEDEMRAAYHAANTPQAAAERAEGFADAFPDLRIRWAAR